jgi:Protein kinase domain
MWTNWFRSRVVLSISYNTIQRRSAKLYPSYNGHYDSVLFRSNAYSRFSNRNASTSSDNFASFASKVNKLCNAKSREYSNQTSLLASIMMVTIGSALVLTNEMNPDRNDGRILFNNDNDDELRPRNSSNWDSTSMINDRSYRLQNCSCAASSARETAATLLADKQQQRRKQLLRSRQTMRKMEDDSSSELLQHRYNINWKEPLGEGSFAVVYLGIDKKSGERVAVKKISKKYTGAHGLQREMHALLHLRDAGGHPNICSLRENFSEDGYYYLILDLVEGGEMFDHLVSQGAYSEADAARLVCFNSILDLLLLL